MIWLSYISGLLINLWRSDDWLGPFTSLNNVGSLQIKSIILSYSELELIKSSRKLDSSALIAFDSSFGTIQANFDFNNRMPVLFLHVKKNHRNEPINIRVIRHFNIGYYLGTCSVFYMNMTTNDEWLGSGFFFYFFHTKLLIKAGIKK